MAELNEDEDVSSAIANRSAMINSHLESDSDSVEEDNNPFDNPTFKSIVTESNLVDILETQHTSS